MARPERFELPTFWFVEKSSLNDAGDVAGGDDQVVRRVWL